MMSRHVGQGLAFIGVSIFAGWLAFRAIYSEPIPPATSPLIATQVPSQIDSWGPEMLCTDEQVLPHVALERRGWLERLLIEMAQEGSYILPQSGNPISEGMTNARIEWTAGPKSVGVKETSGDAANATVEVRCVGDLEIRNAFKEPSGAWSAVFLTVPDATYVITAGVEGFNVELPDPQGEADRTIFHVAGEELPLRRMRQITATR